MIHSSISDIEAPVTIVNCKYPCLYKPCMSISLMYTLGVQKKDFFFGSILNDTSKNISLNLIFSTSEQSKRQYVKSNKYFFSSRQNLMISITELMLSFITNNKIYCKECLLYWITTNEILHYYCL